MLHDFNSPYISDTAKLASEAGRSSQKEGLERCIIENEKKHFLTLFL